MRWLKHTDKRKPGSNRAFSLSSGAIFSVLIGTKAHREKQRQAWQNQSGT